MSPVVLLTGGRAPATLDLARRLRDGGARVHLAESLPWTATAWSSAVERVHRVPGPRQDPDGFLAALHAVCDAHGVDVLIPTCEEVFWVARDAALPARIEPRSRLRNVHDKQAFVELAGSLGLRVPPTARAASSSELQRSIEDLGGPNQVVLKPVFSRFGTSVRVRPDLAQIASLRPTAAAPWAVQRFVEGPVACTWGFAHEGRVTVHTAYRARFTAGPGSAVHFESLADPALRDWVMRFAAQTRWTGHLAFDFVLTDEGPVAIECNPRLTSGVHLLHQGAELLRALTDPSAPVVQPKPGAAAQVGAAMWLYAGPRAARRGELAAWWAAATSAREVSWDRRDLAPFLLQPVSIARLLARAASVGEGVLDATTWDIRWDGSEG